MYKWTKIELIDIRQGAQMLGAKACVFYLLKMYAGHSPDKTAYPSRQSLSEISGISVSGVAKALKKLQDGNWIELVGYTDSLKRTAIWRIVEADNRVCTNGYTPCAQMGTPTVSKRVHKRESLKENKEREEGRAPSPSSSSSSSSKNRQAFDIWNFERIDE